MAVGRQTRARGNMRQAALVGDATVDTVGAVVQGHFTLSTIEGVATAPLAALTIIDGSEE